MHDNCGEYMEYEQRAGSGFDHICTSINPEQLYFIGRQKTKICLALCYLIWYTNQVIGDFPDRSSGQTCDLHAKMTFQTPFSEEYLSEELFIKMKNIANKALIKKSTVKTPKQYDIFR